MTFTNRRIVLTRHTSTHLASDLFALREAPTPPLRDGQVLVKNAFISLEPGLANTLQPPAAGSSVPGSTVGEPLFALTVGHVVESRLDGYREGDVVRGLGGWQDYAVLTPSASTDDIFGLRQLDATSAPLPAWLGVLGSSGLAAYAGVFGIAKPRHGETIVVSAAAGAVGATAGQYARIAGARVVGVAGGPAKAEYLLRDLRFDAAVDHRLPLEPQLDEACPRGVDADFENVGGRVLEALWPRLNAGARIALCGMVSQYGKPPPPGPNLFDVVLKGLTIRGVVVSPQVAAAHRAFEEDTLRWIAEGHLVHREDIVAGLENAGPAFLDLLSGGNLGKRLIAV